MRVFFAGLVPLLLACAAVVFAADPAQRWHRYRDCPTRVLSDGEVQVHPRDIDERAMKRRLVEQSQRPDVVVLGSSRAMLLDQSVFPPPARLLNLGLSGAAVEDLVAMWMLLEQHDKVPSAVVLAVDPWTFNTHDEQARWITLRPEVARANDQLAMGPIVQLATLVSYLAGRGGELAELVSWSSLRASGSYFAKVVRGKLPAEPYRIVPLDAVLAADSGTLWNGVHQYEAEFYTRPTPARISEIARAYALADKVQSLGEWQFDARAQQLLERLVRRMVGRGVDVVVVLTPYQPEALELLRTRHGYREPMAAYRRAARELVPAEAHFCDALEADVLGCEPTEFADALHMLPSCVHKFAARCLGPILGAWTATTTTTRAGGAAD